MSNQDFLSRVEACRREIDSLSGNISQIANLHQRAISSPDSGSSAALENLVSQTQILNTRIRDQIKYLETDAARSGGAVTKDSQIRSLKNQFKNRLEQYQDEERTYRKRYQEQIARQYRIVNPEASEEEVREAATANWGDEGVFQTAVSALPTASFVWESPMADEYLLAEIQPHGRRNVGPRRRPRPPQRHSANRKDAHGTKPALPRPRRGCRDPRAGRPSRRGANRARCEGHGAGECAAHQGRGPCETGAEVEVVVVLYCVVYHHCTWAYSGVVFRTA
jgi:hypothetical protein